MNLFLQELRKIWRPGILAALVVLGAVYYYIRPAFYIEYFSNGLQARVDFELALDWVERFGPTIDEAERAEIGHQLEETEASFAAWAAADPEMAARGLTDYDSFETFHDTLYDNDTEYEAAKERGDLALIDRVLYSGETNYFTVQELRQFLEAWDGESLPDPEEGPDERWANPPRLAEKCRQRVRAMREDRTRRSILPPDVIFSTDEYVRYLAVWCVVSAILLLSPTLVRDRLRRTNAMQWASRRGRRAVRTQAAAALASALLLAAVNLALYFIPFARQGSLPLWDCPIYCGDGGTPWFDWTYGQFILMLIGMNFAFALAAGGLAVFLSQFSANYVPMLLKATPMFLLVGLAVANWTLSDPFFIQKSHYGGMDNPKGIELVCVLLLLAVSLGTCVWTCVRQKKRELI